jgi:hypothetical protein
MKSMILCICLLFLLAREDVNAQCIPNSDFAEYCGTIIYKDGHPTFSDNCVTGWMPSHGTPQIFWNDFSSFPHPTINPTTRPQWNIAYMWADGDDGRCRGEGILSPYNFIAGYTYKVAVRYKVALETPAGGSNGEFRLIATQNIRRPSTWKYGNLLPGNDREQRIATITDKNTNWKTSAIYTYTPDNNYNQFWIYPYTTNYNQYNLYVDWISVCRDECDGSYYYKQGVIPAANPRFGYVYIGSSYGGTGTVTVSATGETIVKAAREIIFKPDFSAIVSTGSFTAKIESCTTPPVTTREHELEDSIGSELPVEDHPDEEGGEYGDEYEEEGGGGMQSVVLKGTMIGESAGNEPQLQIYPNPVQDKISIVTFSGKEGRIVIRVMNSVGTVMKQVSSTTKKGERKSISIDIRDFPAGSYLVQIIDSEGKSTVKKIQKFSR